MYSDTIWEIFHETAKMADMAIKDGRYGNKRNISKQKLVY